MTSKLCPRCETIMTYKDGMTHTIEYDGNWRFIHALSGYHCLNCGEIIFEPESARRYTAEGDKLIPR